MANVKTSVRSVAVPLTLLRAQGGGEFVGAFGGSRAAIEAAQEGVLSKSVKRLSVYGTNAQGEAVLDAHLDLDHGEADRKVLVNTADGMSAIESLDAGAAATVAYAVREMERRGLRPDIRYHLADDVMADPERERAVMAKLGLSNGTAIQRTPGTEVVTALDQRPGKDKGSRFRIEMARQSRV